MANFSISQLPFIPGLELNRRYFNEVLQPLLGVFDPNLRFTASFIGYGSDVLGYDTPTSMDHNWGPRGQIFLRSDDEACVTDLSRFLRQQLPPQFLGYPTNFTDKRTDFSQTMTPCDSSEVNHLVEVCVLQDYLLEHLRKAPAEFGLIDWLRLPEQELVELTSGEVFHDDLGLAEIRSQFHYYPSDIRLIKLAACWNHIANEEAFVGRCLHRGDRLGVKLISTRLLNTLLKMCFVLKERYVPYSKWFTRGFAELDLPEIESAALDLLQENDPATIETKLAKMYLRVLDLQNQSQNLPRVDLQIIPFYNRPFQVIMADRIITPLRQAVKDEHIRSLNLDEVGLDNRVDGIDLNNNHTLEKIL
jgi:uncharacterized protein (UPF0248 family)